MKNNSKRSSGTPGRKPKPAAELHSERFVIKLRTDQLAKIAAEAKRTDKDPSTWAREVLLQAAG